MNKGLILSLLLLAGCATTEPRVVSQTVDVPTPVTHCSTKIPSPPVLPDTAAELLKVPFPAAAENLRKNPKDLNAAKQVSYNVFYAVRLMAAGRIKRDAYIDQLQTALEGCK